MRHVAQALPSVSSLPSLIAALTPIIEEHGYTINQIISDKVIYTVTNPTTSRSLDASAATLADVRNFLGTLISDLQDKGFFG
jgi:hypothetical protein